MVEWRMGMARRLELGLALVAQERMVLGMVVWHMGMDCRLGLVGRLGVVRRRCMVDWRMGMGCRLVLALVALVAFVAVVGQSVEGMAEQRSHMEEVQGQGMVGQRS